LTIPDGSLLIDFAIDRGFRIKLLHFLNFSSLQEEIIVLF